MSNINKIPTFGELLNAGIQTIKNLSNRNTIGQTVFFREFEKLAKIVPEHKKLTYMSTYDIRNECREGTPCYDELVDLVLLCLSAIGLIKENCFSLVPNLNQNFANFITFDEKVTPKNIIRIDPLGKIYFWMTGSNFTKYISEGIPNNDFIADLDRLDNKAFADLKKANIAAYGKNGDPLLNHLIDESMRRTSIFMNNYADATIANDFVKVTPDMIMVQLESLSPLQFEWFCLKLVERSLEIESPESNLTARHTGRSNDNGIDGLISQDFPSGEVHTYYIQAKLYSAGNNVSNGELRNFIGAFPPQYTTHHGIFITTTGFTRPAKDYADSIDTHSLILIDQMGLIELMMEHKVGLKEVNAKPKLLLDSEFFEKIKTY
ncbi:restriction endonuclease [Psychrobacter pygoscelis]|uniref:restriction endonuclease n=1 Tax=Psychrobacter pygoscelis TaxID=2488563 RepID=UPI00103E17B7|nr:restriction endonuclease [Psychrobacter pygoscelis]